MKYQPHIDGIRTIAVLPVVIFHLGSMLFPGGFVGVDVFFVISGFLITSTLLIDIENNDYRLLDFYRRRILRIIPALTAVLIFVFVMSQFIFFQTERIETGNSIVAAVAFVSNFYFWGDAGYFTAPAETKPLLHTWSLAVEEQFYIFFPPLLFLATKYLKRYLLQIGLALIAVSLISCIVLTVRHQPTAFYLLPPRAWELGVGAVLAIVSRNGLAAKVPGGDALGILGLVITMAPMFLLDGSSTFPGWNAIAPVLGAMLLIGWGSTGFVGSLLSSRPFVEIGKISYSLYLWHWPVIVFWKSYYGDDLSALEMVGLGLVSCVLAAMSTYLIERPFRTRKARAMRSGRVVAGGAAVLACVAGLGVLATSNLVSLHAFPAHVEKVASAVDYRTWPDYAKQFRTGHCLLVEENGSFDSFDQRLCTTFDPAKRNVLLIGDSHAAQFWGALHEALPEANVMQATGSGCRALIGAGGAKRCTDLRDWVFTKFLPSHKVDLVVLAGRWKDYEMPFVAPTIAELKKLANHVVVMGPTVEYDGKFPELLARSELTGDAFDFAAHKTPGRDAMNERMKNAVRLAQVPYVDVYGTVCEAKTCKLFAPDGVPMEFDYGHLTMSGARYVIGQHKSVFSAPLKASATLPAGQ